MKDDKFEQIAEICHEANRLYCKMIGDESQPTWADAPMWQKDSAFAGVKNCLGGEMNSRNPEDSHNGWMKQKLEDGWKYGEVKDVDKKEHPCLMPYKYLSKEQKLKDLLFVSIVKVFGGLK